MHVLIAFLTTLASVLFALERLGIDIGWINPWSWRRRRRWYKQYHANPAFSLQSPMEAIALLLAAVAKIDGDLSSEEKNELRQIYEEVFKQTPKEASALLVSSTFLLGSGNEVFSRPQDVLAPSLQNFSIEQKKSAVDLFARVASIGGPASEAQTEYIGLLNAILLPSTTENSWH